jgi:hypothetical protein
MGLKVKIGFVSVVITFFGTFFTILFGCYPISKHWQINPNPGGMFSIRGFFGGRS